jgi:nucleotide-binding universal stress UspA family protein
MLPEKSPILLEKEDAMRPKKILFSSDFSPCSEEAFKVALDWATYTGAELNLLHTVLFIDNYPPNLIAEPETVYQQMEQEAYKHLSGYEEACKAASISCQTHVRKGNEVAETVLTFLDQNPMDWLVLGTHGRKGLNHFLMGSVAEEILRKAPIPVLTVRSGVRQTSAAKIGKIVVPVDFSHLSVEATKKALAIARPGTELHIFHAIEEVNFPIGLDPMMTDPNGQKMLVDIGTQLTQLRQRQLEDWVKQHIESINPGLDLIIKSEMGGTSKTITEYSESIGADLLVMATHGRRGFNHFLLGSVTERVFRTAPCPVLGIKPDAN